MNESNQEVNVSTGPKWDSQVPIPTWLKFSLVTTELLQCSSAAKVIPSVHQPSSFLSLNVLINFYFNLHIYFTPMNLFTLNW